MCLREYSERSLEDLLGVSGGASERLGVSMNGRDAERIDRMISMRKETDFNDLRLRSQAELGDNFVGATWSYVDGVQLRVAIGTPQHRVDAIARQLEIPRLRVVEVENALSYSSRESAMESIGKPELLERLSSLGVVEIEDDALCGRILVRTRKDTTPAILGALAQIVDTKMVDVEFEREWDEATDAVGRDDFQSKQEGGFEYAMSTGGLCTSNIPWYDSGGVEYVVTAGHCIPQSTWASTPNSWGGAWWTSTTSHVNVLHGGTTVGSARATLRYGAELDVAIWPANTNFVTDTGNRTANNTSAYNYTWHSQGWWQWDPVTIGNQYGGDAVGDSVCQSGITQSLRPPVASDGSRNACSTIATRNSMISSTPPGGTESSWFYYLRRTSTAGKVVCSGDSGGTVWSGGWLAGVVKGGVSGQADGTVAGRNCWKQMRYSHVGYIKAAFNLEAPADWS